MNIEKIEIIVVCLFLFIQVSFFFWTFVKIRTLATIIPEKSSLNVDANNNVLETNVQENPFFSKILSSLNEYLNRNRGAVVDFNLMKDVVERNVDAIEEEINLTVGVPLYLGLMATITGIIVALFNMPNIVDLGISLGSQDTGKALDQGIGTLIGGVKIAMIASFVGLLLTVLNSGVFLRISKSRLEARKNDFYTFIQTELMPVVNQDFNSTLSTLQRNLFEFNREFSTNFSKLNSEFSVNLSQLGGFFRASIEAIKHQKELLDSINKTKVSEMMKYNLKVLEQIDTSLVKLDQFNRYLGNLTSLVENSAELVNKTHELLNRTENFKQIAERIESNLSQSQRLLEFLSEHFRQLEEYKQHTRKTVADVGHSISEVFKELKELVQNTSDSVKKFTVDETNLLKDVLSSSHNGLNSLNHLPTIETKISEFKMQSVSQQQIEELQRALDSLLTKTNKVIELLDRIESGSVFRRITAVFTKSRK